jgi:hypothetical protein
MFHGMVFVALNLPRPETDVTNPSQKIILEY